MPADVQGCGLVVGLKTHINTLPLLHTSSGIPQLTISGPEHNRPLLICELWGTQSQAAEYDIHAAVHSTLSELSNFDMGKYLSEVRQHTSHDTWQTS